jgi:hypothetical protein
MDFGLLFEMQVPKPWTPTSESDAFWNSIAQAKAAEQAGSCRHPRHVVGIGGIPTAGLDQR